MGTELLLDILPWALNCRWIFYHGHWIVVGYFTMGNEFLLDILPWAMNSCWIFYHGHWIVIGYFTMGTEFLLDILPWAMNSCWIFYHGHWIVVGFYIFIGSILQWLKLRKLPCSYGGQNLVACNKLSCQVFRTVLYQKMLYCKNSVPLIISILWFLPLYWT